eukprot:tig00020723_g13482.t1
MEIECGWRSSAFTLSLGSDATVADLIKAIQENSVAPDALGARIQEPKLIGIKPKTAPDARLADALPSSRRKITILGKPAGDEEVAPPPEAASIVDDLDPNTAPERSHEEREAEMRGEDGSRWAARAAAAARGRPGRRRGEWAGTRLRSPTAWRSAWRWIRSRGGARADGEAGAEEAAARAEGTQRLVGDSDDEMRYGGDDSPPRFGRPAAPPPVAAASSSAGPGAALPSKDEIAKLCLIDVEEAPLETIFEIFYPDVALRPAAFAGGYEAAVADARSKGRLLVLYLHREGEPEHERFCREALSHPAVVQTLAESFTFFFKHCGDQTLRRFGRRAAWLTEAMARPQLYAIAHTGSLASIVDLVHAEGLSGESLATRLIELHETRSFLVAEAPITEAELMRREQDEAFARSLEEDRRKAEAAQAAERRRAEEQEAAARAEAEAEEARRRDEEEEDAYQASLQRLRHNIPPEPPRGDPDVCEVRIMLPTGDRMGRRFRLSDRLQSIVDHIRCLHPIDRKRTVRLARNFPRQVYTDFSQTLAAAAFEKSMTLFCEYL